jgi:hypothetical protein
LSPTPPTPDLEEQNRIQRQQDHQEALRRLAQEAVRGQVHDVSELWPELKRGEFETREAYRQRAEVLAGPGGLFYLAVEPDDRNYDVDNRVLWAKVSGSHSVLRNCRPRFVKAALRWTGSSTGV